MTQPVLEEELPAVEPVAGLSEWLALQHQEQQQQIADKTAAGLALLWAILQFDRLDETTPTWLMASTLQVEQGFRDSEQAAYEYVQGAKWVVEPFSDPLVKVDTVFPTADFQLAMRATGPASIKRASARAVAAPVRDPAGLLGEFVPGVSRSNLDLLVGDLLAAGKLNSTGVGVKFALNGGRGEIQQLVIEDAKSRREPIGWARFTEDSANGPCYFCAILASQGAVYLDSTSFDVSNSRIREFKAPIAGGDADDPALARLLEKLDAAVEKRGGSNLNRRAFLGAGPAKVHDHCKCTLRPVYRERDDMDARAKYFLRQWKKLDENYEKLPDDKKNPDDTDIQRFRKVYKRPPAYSVRPNVTLPQIQRQRNLVADELGVDSPHVKWWDRQIAELQSLN